MASLNKVMIIGRLGKDPEIRYTQSGQAVANFSMATDEGYFDKKTQDRVKRTEWHNIVVWDKQAESVANYLHKGSMAYVEGSLQTRQWEDQSGQTRYTTEIKAQRVQFLDPKAASDGGYDAPRQQKPQNDGAGPAFPSEASGMEDVPF